MDEKSCAGCEALKELKNIVKNHEKRLNEGNTDFAVIKSDLSYIREALDKKSRFNASTVLSIIQALCTLAVAVIAAKIGI